MMVPVGRDVRMKGWWFVGRHYRIAFHRNWEKQIEENK
jgi:hypothetical protein